MENNEVKIKYSKKNMISYGSGSLAREFLSMAFTTTVFFYYEDQVGLNGWLVVAGIIIFAIYNMFNDPFITAAVFAVVAGAGGAALMVLLHKLLERPKKRKL